ncbi:DUF1648 domain-containing protein [Chryseobacterium sp. c4a]|uniref:DUF1648 domain-containing protein n=1 Tax=Chryseobacterium sp. c4a TaxID=1573582 RepID=UPI00135B59F0|nr:DUF1648 domain-containing protein [Chryseobacterium sp. c4a]
MKTSSILLIVNTLLLIVIWAFTGVKYAGLPEIIPTHFDIHGNVNSESGKMTIWLLPCIAAVIHFLFILKSNNPDSPFVNVPKSFHNQKNWKLYLFTLQVPIMVLFLDIIVESIRIAERKQTELSNVIYFILAVLLAMIAIGFIKSMKEGVTKSND